jgi:hypothetical protein
MKSNKPGRKRVSGVPRRRLIRIKPENLEVFDRYSDAELAEVVNRSLQTIFPSVVDAPKCPIVIRPIDMVTETICRIVLVDREIRLVFPERRDDFAALVKRFKFVFPNGFWSRAIPQSLDIIDRVAEIGNELLCEGFSIQVDSPQVQSRVLDRSFVPESFRMIRRRLKGEFAGCFEISWRRQEDFYGAAMKITAARYSNNAVYVPSEHYLEVEDFAEIHDFELSEAAISLASEAKAIRESAVIVNPKRKSKKKAVKIENPVTDEIPSHLRDDVND